jgi:DNA polymerase
VTLFVDIETYSETDLKKSGVYRYVEDPAFEILMCGWSVDDGPVQVAVGEDAILAKIPWDSHDIVAHHAQFERVCLSQIIPRLRNPKRWDDTQARAAAAGRPQKLELLAKALKLTPKDTAGTRLINLFSKPYRGKRVYSTDRPEAWQEFLDYCAQDVATLKEAHEALPPLLPHERRLWEADQEINDRGIPVDLQLVADALEQARVNAERDALEIREITGVANPNSVQQLGAWLEMPSLAAEPVAEALQTATGNRRRVLELRQELALSAAKKFGAAAAQVCRDGRARGQFRFHGAHTGRWTGSGIQFQNMPRETVPWPEGSILDLRLGLGADAKTLKALVRSMFVGPFTVADYAAIEARVLAWLAGEQWALEAFRAGRDIYTETANRMGGLTRQQGKVAVLALGYNGGVGSLRVMGAQGDDDELQRLVYQWRNANRKITNLWREMDHAFRHGGPAGDRIRVNRLGSVRQIVLPSGRLLNYHGVHGGERMAFHDPRWGRTETYGGRLIENVTQAVARDILADALVRVPNVVAHVHDEIVVEGLVPVEDVVSLMCDGPSWAAGLPLDAEGFQTYRYRKG